MCRNWICPPEISPELHMGTGICIGFDMGENEVTKIGITSHVGREGRLFPVVEMSIIGSTAESIIIDDMIEEGFDAVDGDVMNWRVKLD
ncbi:hypothetical protein L1049_000829 [Liquidambar formosana]|uniref:Uncharacterized protein n=1 Tax=Liquidambar formosana TaxID=63359 RepID=A0AAP0NBQ6_LIQFO